MAQSASGGSLVSIYESRIGTVTNTHEAMGYWIFLAGIILGALGLGTYFLTDAATMGRGIGYALAALAPALLMIGAVLRFPLRPMATYLAGLGGILTFAAVAWFAVIFPGGWSTSTGHTGVILTYIGGLGLVGMAATVIPLATDPRAVEMAELEDDNEELRASKGDEAELEGTINELQRDVADAKGEKADLAAHIRELQKSQAQFEQYRDKGGEYRWRLRHRNGNIIAQSSEGYTQRHNAQMGMQSVRRNALGASTVRVESKAELPEEGSTEGIVVPAVNESQADFELYEDTAGGYRWRLRHENGNIIAGCGQGYTSRSAAANAIDRIREYVGPAEYLQPDPTAIQVYKDQGEEWRWRLVHRNGNILASSGDGYMERASARRAIDSLRDDIEDAEIEIYEDEAGEFRWRIAGEDTMIKAKSDSYESRDGATEAVERVREFIPNADLIDIGQAAFEVYEDDGGEYRWRLRHRNSNVLADGREGYADRTGAWDGIESVKRHAPGAGVEE